jgi:hypothetical protein
MVIVMDNIIGNKAYISLILTTGMERICKAFKIWRYTYCFQETQRLKAEPVPGIEATPDESNARYFHVIVVGPRDVC